MEGGGRTVRRVVALEPYTLVMMPAVSPRRHPRVTRTIIHVKHAMLEVEALAATAAVAQGTLAVGTGLGAHRASGDDGAGEDSGSDDDNNNRNYDEEAAGGTATITDERAAVYAVLNILDDVADLPTALVVRPTRHSPVLAAPVRLHQQAPLRPTNSCFGAVACGVVLMCVPFAVMAVLLSA